jgi:hypothetical protein
MYQDYVVMITFGDGSRGYGAVIKGPNPHGPDGYLVGEELGVRRVRLIIDRSLEHSLDILYRDAAVLAGQEEVRSEAQELSDVTIELGLRKTTGEQH